MRRDASGNDTNPWRLPFGLVVIFTVIVQGLSLSEFLPVSASLLIGAGWGVGMGLLAIRVRRSPRLSAWLEDGLVFVATAAMALLGFGGAVGLLVYSSAMESPSLTGETLVLMFLPSIPVAILGNLPMELLVVPGLLILGWRAGSRRALILGGVVLFLIVRVWTYLVFSSDRLDFARMERSTTPLGAAEREHVLGELHLDDPRWALNLIIFAIFLVAGQLSRVRVLNGS